MGENFYCTCVQIQYVYSFIFYNFNFRFNITYESNLKVTYTLGYSYTVCNVYKN